MPGSEDPEITTLTGAIRTLAAQAYTLSREIAGTVEELRDFNRDLMLNREHQYRRLQRPYEGEDRRRE